MKGQKEFPKKPQHKRKKLNAAQAYRAYGVKPVNVHKTVFCIKCCGTTYPSTPLSEILNDGTRLFLITLWEMVT